MNTTTPAATTANPTTTAATTPASTTISASTTTPPITTADQNQASKGIAILMPNPEALVTGGFAAYIQAAMQYLPSNGAQQTLGLHMAAFMNTTTSFVGLERVVYDSTLKTLSAYLWVGEYTRLG